MSTRVARRALLSLALAVSATIGGCVASKGDIRLLQDELRSMQAVSARADTVRRAQADSALRALSVAQDSMRALSARFGNFQAATSGELYDMARQLLTIQEQTGLSQRRLQELRATLEEKAPPGVTATPPMPGDSTKPAGPGPAQLFQVSVDQMRRGSFGVARSGFDELLTRFPRFEDAPAAQLYVGQAYAEEKNATAADSVYLLVVQRYATSAEAPKALYKYALSQLAQKKPDLAKQVLQRVIREYPRSDEADLARARLGTIK
ncbi:MAG: Tetratricopeptide repeat-containing protein [Gemmatimonadetes bacterium]|nr:Tetratricopeptide repeat-containing protein [Gemmatimonadota bacterium]